MTRHKRLRLFPTICILAILLIAAALRVYHFNEWPPGLSFDEATNAIDAYRFVRTGVMPLYLIVGTGRAEPLHRVLVAASMALIGPTAFGARIVSFFAGVLGVAAAYRAGRHFAPKGSPARRWVGLIAAGTLAVMVGPIHLSRVAYRGIVMIAPALLFFDAIVAACSTGKRRAFVLAGLWLGISLLSYTAALALIPLAGLALLVYLIGGPTDRRGRGSKSMVAKTSVAKTWLDVLAFGLIALIVFSPIIVRMIVQPATYDRVSELQEDDAEESTGIGDIVTQVGKTWRSIYDKGDINPQYNIARSPLLPVKPLYWLALIGIAACLLQPRRLAGWLTLGMTFLSLFPVAMSGEIPHGLRSTGLFVALPLLVAASSGIALWLAEKIHAPRVVGWAWGLIAAAALTFGGVTAARTLVDYFTSDVRWGSQGELSAFSWFFETRSRSIADAIQEYDGVTYVPLQLVAHPSLRTFTLASHPQVTTYTQVYGADGPIDLPAGRFLIPPELADSGTYAAFLPDGRIVLLPRFDDAMLFDLSMARAASSILLVDPYGEMAATVFDYPVDAESFRVETPIAHPVDVIFDNRLRLVGWAGPESIGGEQDTIDVTYYFTIGADKRRDLYLATQLWGPDYAGLSASTYELLLTWLYPPDRWQPGDIVPVEIGMPRPDELDWGSYPLAVGLRDYHFEPVQAYDLQGTPFEEMVIIGLLKVEHPAVDPPVSLRAADLEVENSLRLYGYTLTAPDGAVVETLEPGQSIVLTLYWETLAPVSADYTVFVHLQDSTGEMVGGSDVRPEDGRYPTQVWSVGEIIPTVHRLALPAGATGPYEVYAGLYTWPDLTRAALTQNGEPVPDGRALIATLR
ncbi:MAG: hypothetical protein JXJ17_08820 [Anaerolineae bacterium]|nr:hypothetical protein [Anaerolineae bacterium]